MMNILPVGIKICISDWITLAQDLRIGMNNVHEIGITPLYATQRFALIEAWIGRIKTGDTWYRFVRFILKVSPSTSNDVCAQAVA